ncbi:MAG: hypothetical protein LRY73_11050 [Bacillus sp. (in: Bacteria)]|nr:hypothetical protein [Bacillus sp. (in: firmicutes)]
MPPTRSQHISVGAQAANGTQTAISENTTETISSSTVHGQQPQPQTTPTTNGIAADPIKTDASVPNVESNSSNIQANP